MRRATLSIEPLFVRGVSDGSEASREPLRNVQGRLSSVFPSCTTQRWVKGNDKAKRAMHPNPVQLPSEWYDYWLSNLTSANPLASQVTANAETRQLFSRLNPANYAFDPIVLTVVHEEELGVIAEFLEVVGGTRVGSA